MPGDGSSTTVPTGSLNYSGVDAATGEVLWSEDDGGFTPADSSDTGGAAPTEAAAGETAETSSPTEVPREDTGRRRDRRSREDSAAPSPTGYGGHSHVARFDVDGTTHEIGFDPPEGADEETVQAHARAAILTETARLGLPETVEFDVYEDTDHNDQVDIGTDRQWNPGGLWRFNMADVRRQLVGDTTATDPLDAGDDQTSAINDFITNPTMENLARINRERARTDRLIQMYLAALESGNLDVLTAVMDMVATQSNLTIAEIAARTARLLGQSDEEARRIAQDLAAVNMGATDAETRGRAQQSVQQLQIQLQQNTSARQMITGMLQTAMGAAEDIRAENRSIREKYDAMRRAAQ